MQVKAARIEFRACGSGVRRADVLQSPLCLITQALSYARRARTVSRSSFDLLFKWNMLRKFYHMPFSHVFHVCLPPFSFSSQCLSCLFHLLSSLIISLIVSSSPIMSLISLISLPPFSLSRSLLLRGGSVSPPSGRLCFFARPSERCPCVASRLHALHPCVVANRHLGVLGRRLGKHKCAHVRQ